MSSQQAQIGVCFRYPDRKEFIFANTSPKVGDRLKRNGDEWDVIAVEQDSSGNTVVTLAPPEDGKTKPAS